LAATRAYSLPKNSAFLLSFLRLILK